MLVNLACRFDHRHNVLCFENNAFVLLKTDYSAEDALNQLTMTILFAGIYAMIIKYFINTSSKEFKVKKNETVEKRKSLRTEVHYN